jgi:hypothetical protein
MGELMNNHVKTLEVLSEGRNYKRFIKEGAVSVAFRGQMATGNLVNLSVSGLLADFASISPLPGISEKVAVHLEVGGVDNTLEVQGSVVRIQVPKDIEKQDVIEIAVNFGELPPSVKYGLQKLIKYLLVNALHYKT